MNERRRALVQKFKATAADRVRRVSLALIDLQEARAGAAAVHEVARELHTLKGESNMLGLSPIGAVAHAAETALAASGGEAPEAAVCALVRRALGAVERALEEDLPGASSAEALAAVTAELEAEARRGRDAGPEGRAGAPSPETRRTPASAAPPADHGPATHGAPSARAAQERGGDRWVQISAGRVDALCEQVGGFATEFRALSRRLEGIFRAVAMARGDDAGRMPLIAATRVAAEELDRCRSMLDEIHDAAWALRLSPVDPLLADLVRHAREIALAQGKRARVAARSGGTALPRALLDELWEPLLHLVNNAVDHGIERPEERGEKSAEATLTISAETAGPSVVLTIEDDGRGIDPERVRAAAVRHGHFSAEAARALGDREALDLLFWHGFSTRQEVSTLSGRGVGLDVVRSRVEALGGSVAVESRRGHGTRFVLAIPAAMSRERTLVVDVEGALYGLPFRGISEIIRADEIEDPPAPGRAADRPRRSLSAALDARGEGERWAVVLETPRGPWTFSIPRVVGEFDLLRHALDPRLAPLGYLGGSATLDDGRLVMILSVPGLVRRAEARPSAGAIRRAIKHRVLVVEDAPVVRAMLADVLEDSGLDVTTAGDGREALDMIDRAEPDLVLSDVDMPDMDGMSLLAAVRRRRRRLPFVLLTGRSSPEDQRRAGEQGVDAYLVKSRFLAATLLETVRRLLPAAR